MLLPTPGLCPGGNPAAPLCGEGNTPGWIIGWKEVESLNDPGKQAAPSLQTVYQLIILQNIEVKLLSYLSHYYFGLFQS